MSITSYPIEELDADYSTWHIYADFGDIMQMKVGWSCGNPFYYGYGFDINVIETGDQS